MNRKPKTPLLSNLLKAMNKAMFAARHNMSPADIEAYSKERRKFIKKAIKAAAVAGIIGLTEGVANAVQALSPALPADLHKKAFDSSRIAIIGGGIAGLHAAWILKQKGYIAKVYEGSNRTGGRMFSAQNLLGTGLTTELGGEFIDSNHTDMINLAKKFKLSMLDMQAASESRLISQVYYFNGIHYSEQQVVSEFKLYANRIQADIDSLSDIINVDQFTANDAVFDNLSIAAYFDRIGMNGWLRNMLEVAYFTEFGLPVDQQSAINFLFLVNPEVKKGKLEIFGDSDERYKINGGNQKICDSLANDLRGQVNLGHELLAVKQNSNNSYELTFNVNNVTKTQTCDILLITIPFTLLRNVEVTPAWPGWKRKAIFDIGYGNNSKLILGFNKRYWRDLGNAGYYFTDSILQTGWDSSQLQVPVNGSLTLYTGGQLALNVAQGNIQSQVNKHLPLLNQMYPGATANFNNKAERFIWPEYKWTKASYTCFKPGQYTTIAGNEIKPVGKIFFAGEHCSYDYQGFMNGGAETGRRAAEAIIKLI